MSRDSFIVPVEAPAGLFCKEGTVWCGPPDGAGPPVVRPSGTHWLLLPPSPLPSTALWPPQRPQACSGGHSLPPCGHVFSVTPCLSGPSSSGALSLRVPLLILSLVLAPSSEQPGTLWKQLPDPGPPGCWAASLSVHPQDQRPLIRLLGFVWNVPHRSNCPL